MPIAKELAAALDALIDGEVRIDAMSLELYSTDASIYRAPPLAVVIPRHADDVRAVVEFAADNGLPLLPRGGGTSLEGQTVNEAVVIDMSRHLDGILEIDEDEGWARVQPGVVQDVLRRQLAARGLDFGPDTATATRATLGGMIGNNSAGARSIVHGKTIDHVQEVRCLLADGSEVSFAPLTPEALQAKQRVDGVEGALYRTVSAVVERHRDEIAARFPKLLRRVNGYNLDELVEADPINLSRLIVGSEGTLATVLEARVGIVPLPEATGLGVAQFPDLVTAMEAARIIVPTEPSAVELIDRLLIRQARAHPSLAKMCGFIDGDPAAVLVTEYSGDSEAAVRDRVIEMGKSLRRAGLDYGFHTALDGRSQAEVWQVRKAGLALMLSLKGDPKPIAFVEDTAVAVDRLPEYVTRLEEIVAGHGTRAGFYGHASVGCLHFRPIIDLKVGDEVRKLRSIAEEVRDLVMEFDGALAGEHGDGRTRTEFLPRFFGESLYRAFREIKSAFDPEGRLNPGNICAPLALEEAPEGIPSRRPPLSPPTYRLDDDLRYGPRYRVGERTYALDWSEEGGFDRAVEMCNGNGACRKVDGGTMCPSYMATRDEEHSTRGRANALRSVISGVLGADAFTDRRLHDVMDLCLECKACKAECPSGVDVAKMKYEFLAQYHAVHGAPLRTRMFGHLDRVARWGSRTAPVSNWLLGGPLGRLGQRFSGLSPHRRLPPFRRRTFERWFAKRPQRPAGRRGPVILFHDTFTNHHAPEIGIAAVDVLEAAGYEVQLGRAGCCGRPALSSGLVDEARDRARANVRALAPAAAAGTPIVGCEPSCLSMLREDYADLLPDVAEVSAVAQRAVMIEELLVEAADGLPPMPLREIQGPAEILLHGHCHQKALVGIEPVAAMLGWLPGRTIVPLDSGCCGMAGSFGYEAEHHDVSLQIGEVTLFPAVRDAPEAGLAAAGVSCRQQLRDALGRHARHPVEWLADSLACEESGERRHM